MRTIVVTNERGGIGKTTLTCHIAWHLAEQGKRVVVLDLDKQCHSAGMLKADFEQIGPVQSILDFDPADEPPALACFKNTRQIVELTTDGPQQGQHIGAYVRAIRVGLAKHYDYCVIDTAPAWDGRNLMALIASDYVAIPLDPDKTARQSLNEISQSIHLANKVRGEGNGTRWSELRRRFLCMWCRIPSRTVSTCARRRYSKFLFGDWRRTPGVARQSCARSFLTLSIKLSWRSHDAFSGLHRASGRCRIYD